MKKLPVIIMALIAGAILSALSGRIAGSGADNQTLLSATYLGNNRNAEPAADSINNVFNIGFGDAAEVTQQKVVHIRTVLGARPQESEEYQQLPESLRDFFRREGPGRGQSGQDPRRQGFQPRASGSGVIISSDGYIITSNHLVDNATEVEVSLHNKRTYPAEIVGTDPSTDLAVLKINETDLMAAEFANSDEIRVGDWVLAVGNPFDLASTVTAGIISAKARNVRILDDDSAIESFLQTDAAINVGNSGGALVNLQGELVGINTAIATTTGTYAGYAFAVPSNIVAKVVEDLLEHGTVQRAYLGVAIRDLDGSLAEDLNLDISEGVVIENVTAQSAANQAGIRNGDVIVGINGKDVRSSADLLETVAIQRPGDEVTLTLYRNGDEQEVSVQLRGQTPASLGRN
jgi:serine protease Do